MNYSKHPTLKVGDRVRCLKATKFVDGTSHGKNDILLVENQTLPYYQLFTPERYEVID
jgi:hypothetical protein